MSLSWHCGGWQRPARMVPMYEILSDLHAHSRFSAIISSAMQARMNSVWTQSLGSAVLVECDDEF